MREKFDHPIFKSLAKAMAQSPLTSRERELRDRHERLVRNIFYCSDQYSIEELRDKTLGDLSDIWEALNYQHNDSRNLDYDLHVRLSEV